jgi:hypothetical protein
LSTASASSIVRGASHAAIASSISACAARAVVAGERGIVGEVVAPDRLHQPLEDRIAVAADHDAAVAARIGVRRHDAGQRRAGALAHHAVHAVLGHHAFHHVEHRFVQRDVDDLPRAAVHVAMVQRHHRADHAVQRRDRIADRDTDARRRHVRIAGDVAQPPIDSAIAPKPGRSRYGPVCP